MPRVLLVTNDFPPTLGGIQSYLRDFVATLPANDVVVFASTQNECDAQSWDAQQQYKVYRWGAKVMLPTPATVRRLQEIIRAEKIDTVWFGAAAPLAMMAGAARRAGAKKVIASTHGHEVGWSMLPGARQILRYIGNSCDVVTYISSYTLNRFRRAFGDNPHYVHLPSGVSLDYFQPIATSQKEQKAAALNWHSGGPHIVCISRLVARKGQDLLIRAMPDIVSEFPNAQLIIVGGGAYEAKLRKLALKTFGLHSSHIVFSGKLSDGDMLSALQAADVFAMPARTRGAGLDVEGLGIVYLEAQACEIPVVAGNSGGAPETVTHATGVVVDGRDRAGLALALCAILKDKKRAQRMAQAGRVHAQDRWTWEIMGKRLADIVRLSSEPSR
ncbi:glycosyltransferase family 1 protein [Corynebacterium sp. sy017]|uniref:glycosyltransferase family 4 protein n=1 Tax=unclassified Corynebacterium TaxID=2624378 RepID=UPI0011862164|nr:MULTISPECIES: glycosyltransferase family 4 protein [unclassified Corynebacterium]MBP3087984.1 glycosyltransferase family 1 protein [Corynebacterium sp. sy017]TSD92514.1 glycosyltransferase family 1 protein [Corynebacterium sp. SY003]